VDATVEANLRRRRRRALAVLYVAFLLIGARGGFLIGLPDSKLPPGFLARPNLLLAILVSLGSTWFCTADAKLLGKPIIQLARIGTFLLWPAAARRLADHPKYWKPTSESSRQTSIYGKLMKQFVASLEKKAGPTPRNSSPHGGSS
jgi:hypothetical protein